MRRVECFYLFFFVYILIVKCLLTVLSSGSGRASGVAARDARPNACGENQGNVQGLVNEAGAHPMSILSPSMNLYSGISKFSGAGPLRMRPEAS